MYNTGPSGTFSFPISVIFAPARIPIIRNPKLTNFKEILSLASGLNFPISHTIGIRIKDTSKNNTKNDAAKIKRIINIIASFGEIYGILNQF
jgi:hypothetical protein